MENYSFDLQLFAAPKYTLLGTESTGYASTSGGWHAFTSATNITGASALAVKNSSGVYYVKNTGRTDIAAGATFKGTVRLVDSFAGTSSSIKPGSEKAGVLALPSATIKTSSDGGSLTLNANTLTAASGTGVLTISSAYISMDGVTASMASSSGGTYSLSSFKGKAGSSAGIDTFTGGTFTTNSGYAGTVLGATFTEANKFSLSTDSNGETVYNVAAVSTGQDYKLTGTTVKNWNITGSNTGDSFVTNSSANVTLTGGGGQDTFLVKTSGAMVSLDGGDAADAVTIAGAVQAGSRFVLGSGDDSVKTSGAITLGKNLYFDFGDGNDKFTTASGNIGSGTSIYGGAGNDEIDLTTTGAAAVYELYISGDAGNDKITGNANISNSSVNAGDGNDTIGGFNAKVTLAGGAGADVFTLTNGSSANITDYSFGEDFVYLGVGTSAGTVNTLATTANALKSDGELGIITATSGNASVRSSNGFYAVTALHDDGTKTNLAWVGDSPVTVDGSSQNIASVITGQKNTEADLLIGGTKADTIYAGANDSVYGGQGNDSIITGAGVYGVQIGLSKNGGADTVVGFDGGWSLETADAVVLMDGADGLKGGVSSNNNDVTIKSGSATMTLTGAVQGDETKILLSGQKVDLIKKDAKAVVTDDSTIADYYVGTEKSGIDMTKYTGNVEVNLGNAMFVNITTVEAGSGNVSILGGKAAESLVGGTGATSLYGGAGVDTLVSGAGKTTFFANESSGKDVVTGFVVGTGETSDVINVNNLKSISRSDNTNFTVDLDGTNSLKVAQKSGDINSNIQWASGDATGVAKIGKSAADNKFSYDAATTNYVGSTKTDTVSLTSGTNDNFEVWVDQTGDMFNSIEVYDFSQTSGNVLAAGKANTAETIVAGKGTSSLWGGTGATTDVLQNKNSSATAEFFYGIGDGNDIIEGQKGDSVNLYNLSVSDITKATINSNNVVFTTVANETVTVSGSVGTFKLADGSTWTADYSKKSWTQN